MHKMAVYKNRSFIRKDLLINKGWREALLNACLIEVSQHSSFLHANANIHNTYI